MASGVSPAIVLDPESDRPLFQQIHDALKEAILRGSLQAGTRLPSTRALARELRVARNTVAAAFDLLAAEGFVQPTVGSGTCVTRTSFEQQRRTRRGELHALPTSILPEFGRALLANTHEVPDDLRVGGAFRLGEPDTSAFPISVWLRSLHRAFRAHGADLLGYGSSNGFEPLRRAILDYVRASRGVQAELDQVFLTRGSQEAFDLIARTLLSPGDAACVEDPGYLQPRAILEVHGIEMCYFPLDRDGPVLEELHERSQGARIVLVTPSNQFPLGISMSLQRRTELLELASERRLWVVEDDYDSEFRYVGRPLPCLQSIDQRGTVLYVGTFSKTMFPSLRLGYLVVPRALIPVFQRARERLNAIPPTLEQAALSDFITQGQFARHVRRMRELYRDRLVTLVQQAQEPAPLIHLPPVDGGMHALAWLDGRLSEHTVVEACLRQPVEVRPLSLYCRHEQLPPCLVLGFAAHNEAALEEGVRRLGSAVRAVERATSARRNGAT